MIGSDRAAGAAGGGGICCEARLDAVPIEAWRARAARSWRGEEGILLMSGAMLDGVYTAVVRSRCIVGYRIRKWLHVVHVQP